MAESYNKDPELSKEPKTSSTNSKGTSTTTPDSQEQNGVGIEKGEQKEKIYEKSEEQQEYIDDANNNTAAGNDSPVQDGKGMTMLANYFSADEDEDDDDEDEDDEDDDDGDAFSVGDDPTETKKKMPVM